MNEFVSYLVNNLPLFCISAALLFISFRNLKIRRTESIFFIAFVFMVVFLSVIVKVITVAVANKDIYLATIFSSLGYIVRPFCVYVFVLIAGVGRYENPKRLYIYWFIPLAINIIVYLIPLFVGVPALRTTVFYYVETSDGTIELVRGSFLHFTTHLICAVYLFYLLFVSIKDLRGKHRFEGMVVLICVLFIVATVFIEIFAKRNDLLNIVILIGAMVYYIFVTSVHNKRDALTHLLDRKTFYEDMAKFGNQVNGVIQIDMNGLKYLNDNFGHGAGDEALKAIARVLEHSTKGEMYAYRLSGDEFIIVMLLGSEAQLLETMKLINQELGTTKYAVAMGHCFIENRKELSLEDAMRIAEERMYENKTAYYKESGHNRRKVE